MGILQGKVVIVTGAGQGLGRSEALLLAAEGAAVVVNDMSDAADRVAIEIRAQGGRALAHRCDVADWASAERLVARAIEEFGKLDVLVCNAGIVRDRMLYNMAEGEWDDVVRVHMKGHFAPTHFAAAYWRAEFKRTGARVGGRVIFTTSDAGLYGNIGQSNYSAAKAGIIGLCFNAAKELEKFGITVNAISPRGRTPMTQAIFGSSLVAEGAFDEWSPDNVAPWVAFLVSDHAALISGQIFGVSGGSIRVMAPSVVAAEIDKQERWTPAELVDSAHRLFPALKASPPPLPNIGLPS